MEQEKSIPRIIDREVVKTRLGSKVVFTLASEDGFVTRVAAYRTALFPDVLQEKSAEVEFDPSVAG